MTNWVLFNSSQSVISKGQKKISDHNDKYGFFLTFLGFVMVEHKFNVGDKVVWYPTNHPVLLAIDAEVRGNTPKRVIIQIMENDKPKVKYVKAENLSFKPVAPEPTNLDVLTTIVRHSIKCSKCGHTTFYESRDEIPSIWFCPNCEPYNQAELKDGFIGGVVGAILGLLVGGISGLLMGVVIGFIFGASFNLIKQINDGTDTYTFKQSQTRNMIAVVAGISMTLCMCYLANRSVVTGEIPQKSGYPLYRSNNPTEFWLLIIMFVSLGFYFLLITIRQFIRLFH